MHKEACISTEKEREKWYTSLGFRQLIRSTIRAIKKLLHKNHGRGNSQMKNVQNMEALKLLWLEIEVKTHCGLVAFHLGQLGSELSFCVEAFVNITREGLLLLLIEGLKKKKQHSCTKAADEPTCCCGCLRGWELKFS